MFLVAVELEQQQEHLEPVPEQHLDLIEQQGVGEDKNYAPTKANMTPVFSQIFTMKDWYFNLNKYRVTILLMENLAATDFSYKYELKKIVEQYFKRFPKLSINAMAARSDVPVSTLRRIIKSDSPIELAPHLTLNLLSYIYKEKNFSKLVGIIPEVLADFLKKHFGNFVFDNPKYELNIDLNKILKDPITYFIYKLSANSCGVGIEEIAALYGSFGKEKLDELCKLDLLKYSEGRFFAKDSDFSLDINTMASHLPMLVSKYRPDKLKMDQNLCYSLSESLNEKGIKKVKAAHKKAINEIIKIINDENLKGEIPYFSLSLSERAFYQTDQGEIQ